MRMSDMNWRVSTAELIAVFLFVFVGAGTVMITGAMTGGAPMGMARLLVIALAHGLTIAILIAAIGHISGGHINPAVTFAAMLTKRVSITQGVATIVAQLAGAVLAALALGFLFSTASGGGIGEGAGTLGSHALAPGLDAYKGFLMEVLLTVVLVLVIFGAAMDNRGAGVIAPLAIGFAVVVDHLLGVGITGASMNPARSFGPALIAGAWDNHWVYWAGPLVGAAIAGFGYRYVFQGNRND